MKKLFFLFAALIIILAISQQTKLLPAVNFSKYLKLPSIPNEKQIVVYQESVITKIVSDSLPSVVTIGINITKKIEQNIGSGFIISQDGLIITNKHVVSDTQAAYKVVTNDNKKYDVQKIYRDPLNDLSILKINPPIGGFKFLRLGDSSKIKLGQMAIAIGTPLGEFRNTITSGIVSGLGRGITAGSPYEGYVERLDNVIQTDAAISPGNSGGPLLNSSGEVVGINTAIAQEGQNIGFAIPSNVIRDLITNFNKRGGSFERPYLGVRYKVVDKQTAIINEVAEGAYIVEVIKNSPAEKADIQDEDIITEFDGKKVRGSDDQELARMINDKKAGDIVKMKIWRNGKILEKTLTLDSNNQ